MELSDRKKLSIELQQELQRLGASHEASWILDFVKAQELSSFEEQKKLCEDILERKKKNEPLAYIFREWSFRAHKIQVGPGALIPRPETEELVEAAIMSLENSLTASKLLFEKGFHVADLGAGTGCIGLSFLADLLADVEEESSNSTEISAKCTLSFVEKTSAALPWLEKNIEAFKPKLGKTNVKIIHSDWKDVKLANVDVILSNPPYISSSEFAELDASVKDYEPAEALLAEKPLEPYKELMKLARESLKPGGWFFAEIGPAQGEELQEELVKFGGFNDVRTLKDMAKKARILCAKRSDG